MRDHVDDGKPPRAVHSYPLFYVLCRVKHLRVEKRSEMCGGRGGKGGMTYLPNPQQDILSCLNFMT